LGCAQLGEIPSMNPSGLFLRDDDDDDDDEGTFKREANALCGGWVTHVIVQIPTYQRPASSSSLIME
jgi:hypothetical protein